MDAAAPESVDDVGRVARWRAKAEDASERYRERAQRQPLLGLPLAFFAQYTARQGVLLASAARLPALPVAAPTGLDRRRHPRSLRFHRPPTAWNPPARALG